MQVQVSTFQSQAVGAWFAAPSALSGVSGASLAASSRHALSEVSRVLLRQGWSEAHFSAQSSRLAFRRDGSLALLVQTSFSFTARQQETLIEIRLPAAVLGEEMELKAPLILEFEAWDERLHIRASCRVSRVRPTRRVEDILFDILKAVQEAFRGKEAKSLRLFFDEEAVKILAADEKLRKLVQELLSLVQIIQTLRRGEREEEPLWVTISGKGKPYRTVSEAVAVQSEATRLRLRLIVQAPAMECASHPVADFFNREGTPMNAKETVNETTNEHE